MWCQKTYLHHFTFAYGKEIFDYERNAIDIDRLFSDGEQFGGYDAIIYWNQYPRLGLDERTQWELYDELPGGRKALKTMADACHSRGARFFLPFMPWDVRSFESLDDQAKEIERLVEETGVDGFFLDTMDWIPESFTRLVRDRFPELVFLLGVDAVRAAAHRAANRIVEPDCGAFYKLTDEDESGPVRVSRTSAQYDQPVECRIAEGHAHQTGRLQRHGDGHLAGRFWTMASVRRSSESDGGAIEIGPFAIP